MYSINENGWTKHFGEDMNTLAWGQYLKEREQEERERAAKAGHETKQEQKSSKS